MKKAVFRIIISLGIMALASLTASVAALPFSKLLNSPVWSYIAQGIAYAGIALALALLIIRRSAKQEEPLSLEEIGVCKPKSAILWLLISILLPTLVSAFYLFFIEGVFSERASYGILTGRQYAVRQVVWAVFIAGLGPGVVEELIFRGLIMDAVRRVSNLRTAVFLPSFLFAAIHAFNLRSFDLSNISLLLVGGTTVGIMFSLIRIQSRSVFSGAVVHGVWNVIMIGGIIDIGYAPRSTAIYRYQLLQSSSLLTGGEFGIEVGLPAITGYVAVSLLSFAMTKRCHAEKFP